MTDPSLASPDRSGSSPGTPTSREDLPAKHPRTALAGPYGHPFHPMLVTLPIGAWTASLVLDIAGTVGDHPSAFARGAQWLIGIGLVGAVLAALVGLLDLTTIPRRTTAFLIGITHMALNLAVTVLFVINFVVRARNGLDSVETLPFLLTIFSIALLAVSGWLGGELAYRYGVRVAHERTQLRGFR